MKRLNAEQEADAIQAFCDATGAASEGCEVIYEDSLDSDASSYQVVDGQGHGDGSGEWNEILGRQAVCPLCGGDAWTGETLTLPEVQCEDCGHVFSLQPAHA